MWTVFIPRGKIVAHCIPVVMLCSTKSKALFRVVREDPQVLFHGFLVSAGAHATCEARECPDFRVHSIRRTGNAESPLHDLQPV